MGSGKSLLAVACKRARQACSHAAGSLVSVSAIAGTFEGAKKSYVLLGHQNAQRRFDWANTPPALPMDLKKISEMMPDFRLTMQSYIKEDS